MSCADVRAAQLVRRLRVDRQRVPKMRHAPWLVKIGAHAYFADIALVFACRRFSTHVVESDGSITRQAFDGLILDHLISDACECTA